MHHHKTTLLQGEKFLIVGMIGMIAFFNVKNKVCLGEFKCEGKVLNLMTSSDKKEVFVYTDECKFYRIFNN